MKKSILGMPFRSFFICWICILLVFFVIFGFQEKTTLEKEQATYDTMFAEKTDAIAQAVSETFNRSVTTVASIASMRWYRLFMNQLNLFAEDFQPLVMQDLVNQMKNYVSSLDYVGHILLVIPLDDVVISDLGWMSIREFRMIYGKTMQVLATPGANEIPELIILDDQLFMHTVVPPIRYKKSQFFIVFDKNKLEKAVTRLENKQFSSLRIDYYDECVFSDGEMLQTDLVFHDSTNIPGLELTVSVPSFGMYMHETGETERLILIAILATTLSALLSVLLSKLLWRPILNAIHKDGKTPYHIDPIREIDHLVDQNNKLKTRYDEISAYFSDLQCEMMYGILSGSILYCDYSVLEAIPWLSYGTPYLILIMPPEGEELLEEGSEHDIQVNLFDSLCHIFWFKDDESALREREALLRTVEKGVVSDIHHESSSLHEKFWEIYRQYRNQFEKKELDEKVPITFLYQLTGDIINGNEERALKTLEQAQDVYPAATVENRIRQIATEYQSETAMLDGSWQGMAACVSEICEIVISSKTSSSRKNANLLCRYIEDHFSDPTMSVQMLCDEFNIGRTFLSQQIKEQSGKTFVEYLFDIRMTHACSMLREGQNAMDVGESVGYLNYSTFKRAFIRKYGISPRQWRDEAMGVKDGIEP